MGGSFTRSLTVLVVVLLFHIIVPAFAFAADEPAASTATEPTAGSTPSSDTQAQGSGVTTDSSGNGTTSDDSGKTPETSSSKGSSLGTAPTGTFSVQAFQTDPFTGAATAEIPISVAPGTAGVAPQISLEYSSVTVDEVGPRDQVSASGVGWTLDFGGFILRDPKGTTFTGDDTFKLVFGGKSYDLALVDTVANIYHTRDETFWRVQYNPPQDSWTLTVKDGTRYQFGSSPESRATTLAPDLSAVTYKYLLSQAITTHGAEIRYAYVKQTATAAGRSYDQAVYPDRITYTYHNGVLIGGAAAAREVRFLWAPRSDWTDTGGPNTLAFFERQRLDAIEVWVGTSLVRRYVFGFDYSIDRDPGYTWGGGATGDLTLTSVTQYGTDGTSALTPPLTFTYSGGRLGSVSNGIGGTVSYAYERMTTQPLYSVCLALTPDGLNCAEWGVGAAPDGFGRSTVLGHVAPTNWPGTGPLYSVCLALTPDGLNCAEWGVGAAPDGFGRSTVVGYFYPLAGDGTGTAPWGVQSLYSKCLTLTPDGLNCAEWGAGTTADTTTPWWKLLGHIYAAKVDRHRVTSRSVSDGRGGVSTTSFSYTGIGQTLDGKEFLGHMAVRAVDPAGHYTDSWFHQAVHKGRAYQVQTSSSTGMLYSQVRNFWVNNSFIPGVEFSVVSTTDVDTCEGRPPNSCKWIKQAFQYDGFGNVTQVQHFGEVGVTGDERTEVIEYAPNTAAYIVSLPAHTVTRDAAGATVAETWFFYDSATLHTTPPTIGNLTRRCQWLGGGVNPCVTMTYDVYGNLTATTDARGNMTTTTYDAAYQTFPATVSTPPTPNAPGGLVSTAVYDARFGLVTSTTDPNGQTTTYQYDVFGRPTSITNPLGQTTTTSYDAIGTVGSQRITSRLPDGTRDGLWSEEYFDGLGRTFKVRKEAAGGRVILLETTFDNRGLVNQRSLPRVEGAAPVWMSFAYDPLGRPTTTTFPDGTTETTTYLAWTTTFTDRNGRTRTSVKDAYGLVRQIAEPGGAVTTYAYDPMGRLITVTDAAGNVTRIVYDTLGRKVQMTEPNMGTWSYAYDANGSLTSQTDAKGQTLTFAYDALNRLTTKTSPGGRTVSFLYDEGVNGKGRRTRVTDTDPAAGSASYAYDVLGRQTSTTRVIDSVSYTTQTAYTELGQPASITYPDGEVVKYTYDTAGQVFSVVGASTYVKSIDYNAAGQLVALQYGNGVTATWAYDPATSRLSRQQSYTATPMVPLTGWAKSWATVPAGFAAVYRGGICVADVNGTCVGGDIKTEAGVGPAVGYMRTSPTAGTVPAYQSHCYSNATGTCTGWGLSLTANGIALGHLSTAAPDAQSASAPLAQSGGLLLQGLSGATPSAYLWTSQSTLDHLYATDGSAVAGYTSEGTIGYLHPSAEPGLVALLRFVDASTGVHYYSTAGDAPLGYTQDAVLGYLHATTAADLVAVYRHYNAVTGDYLLSASPTPPGGYQLQATLGYAHATGAGEQSTGAVAALQDLNYTYDPVGNITAIADTRAPVNNQAFTYDVLDRLVSATGPYGTHTYTYNAIGNILSKAGMSYTYPALGQTPTAQTCNRVMPHAVTATSDGKSYAYDCNGNLLSDGERTFTWDADNRPTAIARAGVGTTTFTYSGDGARVKKVGPTRTVRYVGSFEDQLSDNARVKHIFAGSIRVATRVVSAGPNAGTYFVHGDHLGGLNVLTNSTGAEVQRLTYLPFGETSTNVGSADFHDRRYTGQRLDPETGLYFYEARYYHPALGRFISPDAIVPGAGNPQNLNRYSYVNNNPINFTDPTGHFSFKRFFKGLLKALPAIVVGIGVGILTAGAGAPAAIAGMLGGMSAGAVNTGVNGGNLLMNVVLGGALGALGGGLGVPLSGALGGGLTGAIGSGAIMGAGLGALGSAVTGGNILDGALAGGLSGAIIAAGVYGGYKAWQWLDDPVVRVGARPITSDGTGEGLETGAEHKFIEVRRPGPSRYIEMGPQNGKIYVYDSTRLNELTPTTQHFLTQDPQAIKWGPSQNLSGSRFEAALSTYKAGFEGLPYEPYAFNSNHFVNSVISNAGGNPVVPGAFAPTCTPLRGCTAR